MTVYRVGSVWRAEVFHKGKRVASESGFAKRSEAKDWHDTKKRALKDGPTIKDATFDELMGHFRNWHLPKIRPGTRRRYEVDLVQRIEPAFRHYRLSDISGTLIEQFATDCQKDLQPKSVNNCLHLLRLVLNKAVKWKFLAESPYAVETLKIAERPYEWWEDQAHIRKFLAAAKESRYYAVYLLALETGLRYGEIAGLSPSDVDLARAVIHVHRQWLEREGCYGPPKHGKERWVDFSPQGELAATLRTVLRHNGGPRLFTTATGSPITKSGVAHKFFKAAIRRAQVPVISFHGLRHTFASWYMIRHDNVWDLAAILGHSNIKTTMRYAHQSKRARRKPLDLASITQNSRTELRFRDVTGGDQRGKEWRDGRDSNPRSTNSASLGKTAV